MRLTVLMLIPILAVSSTSAVFAEEAAPPTAPAAHADGGQAPAVQVPSPVSPPAPALPDPDKIISIKYRDLERLLQATSAQAVSAAQAQAAQQQQQGAAQQVQDVYKSINEQAMKK